MPKALQLARVFERNQPRLRRHCTPDLLCYLFVRFGILLFLVNAMCVYAAFILKPARAVDQDIPAQPLSGIYVHPLVFMLRFLE